MDQEDEVLLCFCVGGNGRRVSDAKKRTNLKEQKCYDCDNFNALLWKKYIMEHDVLQPK
jgi:hypothetical protein